MKKWMWKFFITNSNVQCYCVVLVFFCLFVLFTFWVPTIIAISNQSIRPYFISEKKKHKYKYKFARDATLETFLLFGCMCMSECCVKISRTLCERVKFIMVQGNLYPYFWMIPTKKTLSQHHLWIQVIKILHPICTTGNHLGIILIQETNFEKIS